MFVRVALVSVVAAAAAIAAPGAGSSPAPALTLVAASYPGSSGAVPPIDGGQGAAQAGIRADWNAAEGAAIERARRDADTQAAAGTAMAGHVGARADKNAAVQAVAERARRAAAKRANAQRAEQEATGKAARRADPSLVGAVPRTR
jgi:hypothetical protein